MGIAPVREWDISSYNDALMRWAIISNGEGAKGERCERLWAGARVSHAIGEGEAMGDYVSGFHPTSGAGMGLDGTLRGAGKAGITPCHDSPRKIKASPAASCTRESPIMHGSGQSRAGRDAEWKRGTSGPRAGRKAKAKDGTAGRPAGQHTHGPPPHGSTPDLLYAMTSQR